MTTLQQETADQLEALYHHNLCLQVMYSGREQGRQARIRNRGTLQEVRRRGWGNLQGLRQRARNERQKKLNTPTKKGKK